MSIVNKDAKLRKSINLRNNETGLGMLIILRKYIEFISELECLEEKKLIQIKELVEQN